MTERIGNLVLIYAENEQQCGDDITREQAIESLKRQGRL